MAGSWSVPRSLDKTERPARDKHSCLLRTLGNTQEKVL
jgi:hypothetical protein